jgi:phenylalanine-4-hydroxylase
VLNEFKKTMAWKQGGLPGVKKAIASKNTGTIVFDSGLQISGTFTEVIDNGKDVISVKTTGPSALSVNNIQMEEYGKERFPNGISVSFEKDQVVIREGDVVVELPANLISNAHKIVSVFAGPADPEAFEPNVNVPREKMHKVKYDKSDLELHELYRHVRNARSNRALVSTLPKTWQKVSKEFPSDWLLPLEILEVLQTNSVEEELQSHILNYLETKATLEPSLKKLIDNGLSLLRNSFTTA